MSGSLKDKVWLHSDGARCLFGDQSIVLHGDGSVSRTETAERGSWTGDSAYFRVELKNIAYLYNAPTDSTTCERAE
jgi:hypothetical protein